jgi:hypothetical protein
MGLKHDIQLKQAAILQNRRLIAVDAQALKQRTLRALATPPALAGSFGIGLVLAMLRCRRSPESASQGKSHKRHNLWLRVLLREALVPLVLGVLHTPAGQDASYEPPA